MLDALLRLPSDAAHAQPVAAALAQAAVDLPLPFQSEPLALQ